MQNKLIYPIHAQSARFKTVNSGNSNELSKVNSATCLLHPVLSGKRFNQADCQ